MFGLTVAETYLSGALVLVVLVCGLAISAMNEAHQERRDQRRKSRTAARARERRARAAAPGGTVGPAK